MWAVHIHILLLFRPPPASYPMSCWVSAPQIGGHRYIFKSSSIYSRWWVVSGPALDELDERPPHHLLSQPLEAGRVRELAQDQLTQNQAVVLQAVVLSISTPTTQGRCCQILRIEKSPAQTTCHLLEKIRYRHDFPYACFWRFVVRISSHILSTPALSINNQQSTKQCPKVST